MEQEELQFVAKELKSKLDKLLFKLNEGQKLGEATWMQYQNLNLANHTLDVLLEEND